MAVVDISKIDDRVQRALEQWTLYLASPEMEGTSEPHLFVTSAYEPSDSIEARVGYVVGHGRSHTAFVMNGGWHLDKVELEQAPGLYPTWEDGIMAILRAFEQHRSGFVRMLAFGDKFIPRP
ncbi:hypothetical protein ACFWC5_20635 [Streptomyces sp. NPDC060085]|uniref:hypothetical protein n=1 Tax=Streptomyces sp. NPDC060085 TaxID=3347054 RepID=UPI003650918C